MSGRFVALNTPRPAVSPMTAPPSPVLTRGHPKSFLRLRLLKVEGHPCWCLYIAIGRIHSESVDAICAGMAAAPAHHSCVASSTLRSTAVVPLESLMEFSVANATFCFVPFCFRNCRYHNYVFYLFPGVDNLYVRLSIILGT